MQQRPHAGNWSQWSNSVPPSHAEGRREKLCKNCGKPSKYSFGAYRTKKSACNYLQNFHVRVLAIASSTLPCSATHGTTLARCRYFPSGLKTALCGKKHPLARLREKRLSAALSSVRSPTWAGKPPNTASQSAIQAHPPSLSLDSSPFSGRALHLTGRRVRRLLTVNQWQPRCD